MKRPLWMALATLSAIALGGALLLFARPNQIELGGTSIDDPPSVRDVALVDTTGREVRLSDWEGQMVLAFFGYANCPDVCPLTMAKLAGTYRDLGEPENLHVIMVTVDPQRDTPEALRNYVENFHPDFVGLTGTPRQIAEASARFYATSVERAEGEVAHSSHVTLVDPSGRMRVVYNQDKLDGVLRNDLQALLTHEGTW